MQSHGGSILEQSCILGRFGSISYTDIYALPRRQNSAVFKWGAVQAYPI